MLHARQRIFTTIFLWLTTLFLMGSASADKRGPAIPDYPADRVAPDVYVIHGPLGMPDPDNMGFMNNPGFVVTGAGVVVIDPGSSVQSGEMVLRQIRKVTSEPVVGVFNTHVHGDHWLGNQAILEAFPKATIYGHPNMREEIAAGAGEQWVDLMASLTEGKTIGTAVVPPDQSAVHGDRIVVGDYTFRIHHQGHAHTNGDLMIEVAGSGVLFLGDIVTFKRIPRMDDGTFMGNIRTASRILGTEATVYVPGHGPTGDASIAKAYITYLQTLYDEVKVLYEEGLSDFEMKDRVVEALKNYSEWVGFEREVGKHISLAYLEIEQADF